MRRLIRRCFGLLVLVSCAPASGDGTEHVPGAPLAELSQAELAAFTAGRALFEREFSAEEGLGPSFNDRRCSACHDLPAAGGMGAEVVHKATRFENGRCDLLLEAGGDMLQQSVTEHAHALGVRPERVPMRATAVVTMIAPPLFGVGLMEAIPEDEIRRRVDPDDRDGDGISGRAGIDAHGKLARFGQKANFATVRAFIAHALLSEMGLTSAAHPVEASNGGAAWAPGIDTAADPEVDEESIDLLTSFVTLLAATRPDVGVNAAARDSMRAGERHFERIGCALCHTPAHRTSSDRAALNKREVSLYSDLLLHDMGSERASVCAPGASPSEWRTPVLAGLRYRHRFLHDGSAQNLNAAIEAHGGEGARSRAAFRRLSAEQQTMLLRFLSSL